MNEQNATAKASPPDTGVEAERNTEQLELVLSDARRLMHDLVSYLGATGASGLLRDIEELARRQPSLALTGAFLLGLAAPRSGDHPAEQAPQPGWAENDGDRAQPQSLSPLADLRQPAEPFGVGSPIADAPFAGGSSAKGPL